MEKSKECIGGKVINLHEEHGSLGRFLIMQGRKQSLALNLRRQLTNMKYQWAGESPLKLFYNLTWWKSCSAG